MIRMRRQHIFRTLFFIALVSSSVTVTQLFSNQSVYSKDEVEKVLELIEKIQSSESQHSLQKLRKVSVTENEFNSYVAYRIESEKEELMKELQFKFLKRDRLEGKAYVDLRGQDIPKILRPEMTFYFSAKVDVQNQHIRIILDKLFLEEQEISPAVLDLVIMLGSQIGGWDSGGINDWYALPYGIKDIKVHKGYADFFY
jgi:hypothetical protein